MIVGVNTYSLGFAGSMEARLELAGKIGFEGIEFRPADFGLAGDPASAAADAKKIVSLFGGYGVKPCCVACDADFVQPERAKFDEFVRLGDYCAALSAQLGLKVVKYFAGEPKPDLTDEQIVGYMIEGSKKLAELGDKYGVAFAEENHGRFTNRPEVQRRLLDEVGSPRLGVCIDSSNYRWFGHSLDDVHRIYREMAPHTLHTHMKDGDGSGGPMGGYKATALGEGELDIPLLARELKKNGYTGALVLEYEGPDGEAGVRRSFEYLKKLRDDVFGG